MARKIIVTKRIDNPSYIEVNRIFWLDVPVARQAFYANPSATSQAPNVTALELTAIQTGAVNERTGVTSFTAGTVLGAIGTQLVTEYGAAQAALTNINDYKFYGSSWDGTTWTVIGN